MLDFHELRNSLNDADVNMKKNIGHLGTMAKDAKRVSDIAKNASIIIKDIDRDFEKATGLTGIDITFLFLATALQIVRWYFLTTFKVRKGHNDAADDAKKIEKKVLGRETKDERIARMGDTHRWYRPSIEEVTFNPVPYDQTAGLTGLGGAFEHRARTPGHDAILGHIFGTANIATSTLTAWNMQTFHIKYGDVGGILKPMGTNNASIVKVFDHCNSKLIEEGFDGKSIMAISLFRQAMHIKSDIYSKKSLPLPIITTISPDLAKDISKYGFDLANITTVGKQVTYAVLINTIIAMLHRLMYDYNGGSNLSLYEVRTRKILSYSNLLATASNVLLVSITGLVGVKTGNKELIKFALEKMDIGGLLVTIYRIATDSVFIGKVKQEFLEKEFYNLVMGDDFDF